MMVNEELRMIQEQVKHLLHRACEKYIIYGNVFYYEPSSMTRHDGSNRNRLYLVAGLSPSISEETIPKWLDPDYIIRQSKRNENLFYPKVFALELTPDISMVEVNDQLVEYAKRADFLKYIYGSHDMEVPEKLRLSEVNHIIDFYDATLDYVDNPYRAKMFQKRLDKFFKKEKRNTSFQKSWMDYYRSEKFPDGKGPISKILGYFKRYNAEIPIEQLMDVNGDIRKLQMQEFEYILFREYIQDCYPEVSISAGRRDIVNHGLTPNSQRDEVAVRHITWEEYCVIRKERFAKEGFEALADIKPAYWDFRDVYYRAVDEPIIAATYNMITLQYAQPNSLSELKLYGDLQMEDIPLSEFMNFVSLAKANGLRFYLDTHGVFAHPELETIHVVYNECQQEKMESIIGRIINDKVEYSYARESSRPSLQSVIHEIEHLQQPQESLPNHNWPNLDR